MTKPTAKPLGAALAALSVPLLWTLLAGCGSDPAPTGPPRVSFQAAENATAPVSIEGILEPGSLARQSGQPTEFQLKEESSARKLTVTAPDSQVPSNITTSLYVTATGTYDAAEKRFVATEIRTRVPNRAQQTGQ